MANLSAKPSLPGDSHITSWPLWVSSRLPCPCCILLQLFEIVAHEAGSDLQIKNFQ